MSSVVSCFAGSSVRGASARSALRLGFVVPRYGASIGGGAETLVLQTAERLAARGDMVEVFTTCALDNRTWDNKVAPGTTTESGVIVHRFPVDLRNLDVWVPLQIRLSEGLLLSTDEQLDWLAQGVNSQALYKVLAERAGEFDALFFAPYLFGTTFFGSLVAPQKSILIPCLHDEAYAYVEAIQSMFRQVRGCMFNASPEQDLAERLYGPIAGGEVGMGFVPHTAEYPESLEPYFREPFRYVLYVGRKETGKNAQVLVDHFLALKQSCSEDLKDLKLVIAGGGSFADLGRPQALTRSDIVDISHVSERDKHRLIRHAEFLCQPSTNESFSIVLMESWLLGAPVLVHADCPVTRTHCVESGGGLYFSDEREFAGVAAELCRNPELRAALARGGMEYVKKKYSWESVLERFDAVLTKILAQDPAPVRGPLSKNEQRESGYGA